MVYVFDREASRFDKLIVGAKDCGDCCFASQLQIQGSNCSDAATTYQQDFRFVSHGVWNIVRENKLPVHELLHSE